MSKRVKFFY